MRMRLISVLFLTLTAAILLLMGCQPQAVIEEETAVLPPTTEPTAEPTIAPTAASTSIPTVEPTAASTAIATPLSANAEIIAEVDDLFGAGQSAASFTGAALIAKNGEILLSEGYGLADKENEIPNTPQTKFRIGSVTKPFTAVSILLLQEQGVLTVQDPICDYLADCPDAWAEITIDHLLTHSSGIPNFTTFADYSATQATPSPPQETIARFTDRSLNFAPGSSWNYSNSGYVVLGQIIEAASGQDYETFLEENIFAPLGMTGTGYLNNTDGLAIGYGAIKEAIPVDFTVPYAAGGLYSTVEDLHRFAVALFDGELLAPDSLATMQTPFYENRSYPGIFYGYGLESWQAEGMQAYGHYGSINGFVANWSIYPEEEMIFIFLSNKETYNLEANSLAIERLIVDLE